MNYIIYSMPRSRSKWLSTFLTYKDWHCGHDELQHLHNFDDVKSWISQENIGSVETAAAPWWRLFNKLSPNTKIIILRRNLDDVVNSYIAAGANISKEALYPLFKKYENKLNQIEKRHKNSISVTFEELRSMETCRQIFEYCLPYEFDVSHWLNLSGKNIQINMQALLKYCAVFKPQFEKFIAQAKAQSIIDLNAGKIINPDGITIQKEPFETYYNDAVKLFKEHLVVVGEHPDNFANKNIPLLRTLDQLGCLQILTARCNGRMFGYLMTVIGPSLESQTDKSAFNLTFFASKEFPGLGLKLQRAAVQYLKETNVDELFLRAGTRGSGNKLDTLYKRLGAEDFGHMYKLDLKGQ